MAANSVSSKPLAVYVHIPFCVSKCQYCDFNSYSGMLSHQGEYFVAMESELEKYTDIFLERGIGSVFFGGGTPTTVDANHLINIISKLKPYYKYSENNSSSALEVSIECNPGTVDLHKLTLLCQAGFNRISFGLQSVHDTELSALGRVHLYDDFAQAFFNAREAGFKNINVDLMFGIPEQTVSSWRVTLATILNLRPEHISAYALKVEEDTPFYNRSDLNLPDEDDERTMYKLALEFFATEGYGHYEISNWSLPNLECKQNLTYWMCEEYVGLGAGAHSYLDDLRFGNVNDILEYIKLAPNCDNKEEVYKIDRDEQMKEFVMLGLRCCKGVSQIQFRSRFGINLDARFKREIEKLLSNRIVEFDDDFLKLTPHGFDFANEAFIEFV